MVAFNASCIGFSHQKSGKKCQDFSQSWSSENAAIIAVADGHGSDDYFRSDRGARFAVEAALQCIQELIMTMEDRLPDPDAALETLEKSIIAAWHEKIIDDVRNDVIDGDIFAPYGTTLLAAAITRSYWFGIQIGDGKCNVLWDDDKWTQPIPWDTRCFLNSTTSICDSDAAGLFRHFYHTELPAAIFIGTDGVDNSYPLEKNNEYLSNLYQKLLENFAAEGLSKGKKQLQKMLPLFSEKGSCDDVSIAGIILSMVYHN